MILSVKFPFFFFFVKTKQMHKAKDSTNLRDSPVVAALKLPNETRSWGREGGRKKKKKNQENFQFGPRTSASQKCQSVGIPTGELRSTRGKGGGGGGGR